MSCIDSGALAMTVGGIDPTDRSQKGGLEASFTN